MTIANETGSSADRHDDESGVSILFISIMLTALLGAAAFTLDLGNAFWTQRKIHYAADAGALAAVQKIIETRAANGIVAPSDQSLVVTDANTFTTQNAPNVTVSSVTLGTWLNGTFTPGGTSPTAVRVVATEEVPTFLARLFDIDSVTPVVSSTAAIGGSNTVDCLVPFGIGQQVLNGKTWGDTINVNVNSPGNWGKLDMGINGSCAPCFQQAMANGVCGFPVQVGDDLEPGTGNGGLQNGFQDRADSDNPYVTIPVVQTFLNGNHDVSVVGFVVVKLVKGLGKGSNWNGVMELVKASAGEGGGAVNPAAPFAFSRMLVE